MNAIEYATEHCQSAFEMLRQVTGDLDDAFYNREPGGTASSVGKTHVHALTSMDFFVNVGARGSGRLWARFASAHGLTENPREIWTSQAALSLDAINEFADELQAVVIGYIQSLSAADFDSEVETQVYGRQTRGALIRFAATHSIAHGGEIAAAKGVLGLKGLPF